VTVGLFRCGLVYSLYFVTCRCSGLSGQTNRSSQMNMTCDLSLQAVYYRCRHWREGTSRHVNLIVQISLIELSWTFHSCPDCCRLPPTTRGLDRHVHNVGAFIFQDVVGALAPQAIQILLGNPLFEQLGGLNGRGHFKTFCKGQCFI